MSLIVIVFTVILTSFTSACPGFAYSERDEALEKEFKRVQQIALSEYTHQQYRASLASNRKMLEIANKMSSDSLRQLSQRWALQEMARIYGIQKQYDYSISTYHLLIDCDKKADPLCYSLEADYKDLAEICMKAGKTADAQKFLAESKSIPVKRDLRYKKSLAAMAARGAAEKKASEESKEATFRSSWEEAAEKYGKDSKQEYFPKKWMAEVYLQHGKFAEAEPLYRELVTYSQNSKNYFDNGKEWDARRKAGVPTTAQLPDFNGRPVIMIDNRRPSAKIDKSDLLENLTVLAEIERRQNESQAASTLKKAQQVFQDRASHDDANREWSFYSKTSPYTSFQSWQQYVLKRHFPR